MKNISYYFVLLLLFSFANCTDSNSTDDPPDDDPSVINIVEKTINEIGGVIELEDLILSIPEGAFESSNDLIVSVLDQNDSGFDQTLSAMYRIEGLPQTIKVPIQVSIKNSGSATENAKIAIGESTLIKSLDEEEISYQLTEATEDGGYIIGEIPVLIPEGEFIGENIENRDLGKITLTLLSIAGYTSVLSSNSHFRINAPSSLIDETLDLADFLEAAYSKFSQLGFSYSKRTKWPIHVNVKGLKVGVSGYSVNSFWGNNYAYLEINKSTLSSENEMKVTAGHEFFHLIQAFYDPRNSFSKAKFQPAHLWVDEAMSVWSEEIFASVPNYVSPVFVQNADLVLKGMKLGIGEEAASYGYGMAIFIKYIAKKYGEDKLVKIYDEIKNDVSPVQAINKILPIPIHLLYDNFLDEFLSFKLYKNEDFKTGWLVSATGSPGYFKIASKADSVKKFKLKYPDLSARVFYLKNDNFKDFEENTYVSFELDGNQNNQIMLFKFNSSECQFLNQGQDTLSLDGFKAILDDGFKVVAVVTHQKMDYPYGDEKELELIIRIKEKFEFDYIDVNITGNAQINIDKIDEFWGDTTYINSGSFFFSTGNSPGSKNQTHIISGNSIFTSVDFQDQYGVNRTFDFIAEFDNIKDPKNIISFSFTETYSESFNGGVTNGTKSISLMDIPFEYLSTYDEKPSYYFHLPGNINSNILDAAYSDIYTWSGGSLTQTLLEFNGDDGNVNIFFRQKP